jgi:hypothetical protein
MTPQENRNAWYQFTSIQLLMNGEIDAFIVKTFCQIQNGRTLQKVSDLHAGQTARRTV